MPLLVIKLQVKFFLAATQVLKEGGMHFNALKTNMVISFDMIWCLYL